MSFFDIFKKKKNENINSYINYNFKSGDKFLYKIFKNLVNIKIYSTYKNDGEPLSNEEVDEVNWLLTNNLLDNKSIQNKVLKYINKKYKNFEDNFKEKSSLQNEISIHSIVVCIDKDDLGDTGDVSKIVAFCGEASCDIEHGISISFKNKKYMSTQPETEYNYDPNPSFNYLKWKEENPLMGMVPKYANILIKNGFTDKKNICFFNQIYFGKYTDEIKNKLQEFVCRGIKNELFKHYAISIKDDKIFFINHPYKSNLAECIKNYVEVLKSQIIECFILIEIIKLMNI